MLARWAIFVLAVGIGVGSITACSADDEDDDAGDDAGDDVGDDDTDLPPCEPFAEPTTRVDWSNVGGVYGDYLDERDGEGVVTATVAVDGDAITIAKGAYVLALQWLREDAGHPFTDGQTVALIQNQEAGDDGCCDTDTLQVWDESGNLLAAYAWQTVFFDRTFGGVTHEAGAEWADACVYEVGERPREGELDWDRVSGLSLAGYYEDGEYAVEFPGGSAVTDDGLYDVNWPVGYRGEFIDDGEPWYTQETIIEIVRAAD